MPRRWRVGDATITQVVARYLEHEGYRTLVAGEPRLALRLDAEERPDLVVLDLMLPGIDGLQVMAAMRQRRPVPVILLTARGEEADRIRGLRLGADDYVVKPFSPQELLARIDAVLRRAGRDDEPQLLAFGDVEIDVRGRTCTRGGEPVELAQKEFDLIAHLARHPGRAFSRAELMEAVWRYSATDTSTVTVHVRRVRQKLEQDPLEPRHLQTVWGVGYRLVP